ncbi:hypothetical protein [Dokdonia sp.]|uniref:hypothetical protein n=1 Tax=Dokdonia sp. TaxID=2024995 RepID=UPI003266F184
MIDIRSYFSMNCYNLSASSILQLNKHKDSSIQKVISGIEKNCFAVQVFKNGKYVISYIDNNKELNGLGFNLSLKIDVDTRTTFTIEFCKLVSDKYQSINFVDAFNTFQIQLRDSFDKIGYVTLDTQFFKAEKLEEPLRRKGVFLFPELDKLSIYRWFFDENEKNIIIN